MRRKCQRSSRSANTACTGKENQQCGCLYATPQVLEAVNECLSRFASLSAKKFTSVLWLRRPCLRNKMRLTEGLRIFNWILLRQVAFTFSEISPQKNSTPDCYPSISPSPCALFSRVHEGRHGGAVPASPAAQHHRKLTARRGERDCERSSAPQLPRGEGLLK